MEKYKDQKGLESQTTTHSIAKLKAISLSNHLCSLEKSPGIFSSLIQKPLYLYLVWPGKNIFLFGGRIMLGPKPQYFLLNLLLFWLVSLPYFIYVCPSIGDKNMIITTILGLIFFLYTSISYFLTSFVDPGILPRKNLLIYIEDSDENLKILEGYERKDEENSIKSTKNMKYDSKSKTIAIYDNSKTKYYLNFCEICKIYQPPLSKHCKLIF